MKPLTCIAVDDSELDRLVLSQYLSRFQQMTVKGIFPHPQKALSAIREFTPDVIFLDIDMPDMSGLELRRKVSEIPVCVFITSHPEYAVESFELETLDYLVKPFTFERFSKTMERIGEYFDLREKAIEFESQKEEKVFYIKEGHKRVRLLLQQVSYLKAFQNYTLIYTPDKKHCILFTLGALLEDEIFSDFIRVHRSYAVQKSFVETFSSREIQLSTGDKIPVGRSYKDEVESLLGI